VKFSVVIPLYNKAPHIESAVQSVLDQTFADFEVIVIDDGSTDGGGELVKAMRDARVRVVAQPNAGVSMARNLGISIAAGEWVAFLDADDWHHPRHLESLVQAQELYPSAEMVSTTYHNVPHCDGAWPPMWKVPDVPGEIELILDFPSRWTEAQTINSSTVAVRTSRLLEMQPCFAPGESHGEDIDLWFRIGERWPVALVHSPLVAYRISLDDSLSTKNSALNVPPFLQRMRDRSTSKTLTTQQRRSLLRLIGHIEVTLARDALALGRRYTAAKLLLCGSHTAQTRRWWLTAAMVFLFPGELVRKWQSWRVQRTTPPLMWDKR
jgi:glycosyltransferase involved in cell wall biosynthesis